MLFKIQDCDSQPNEVWAIFKESAIEHQFFHHGERSQCIVNIDNTYMLTKMLKKAGEVNIDVTLGINQLENYITFNKF